MAQTYNLLALRTAMVSIGLLALASALNPAAAAPAIRATWTTLGTNSGPIPHPKRSEPANLLRSGDQIILVDAGDGASVQLAKAGVPLATLRTIFISHLHFDHTGGLFAIIAERFQMLAPGVLTIYGPPGTSKTIDGLIAAMAPSPASGPSFRIPPAATVQVVEISDGSKVSVGDVVVTAAANSHYRATPGGDALVSLSYRFETPGRSIAYTGDTGPSANVERLARGVDLLVSEVSYLPGILSELKKGRPDLPPEVLTMAQKHFEQEHLSPEQAGLLALHAQAKALVLTHNTVDPETANTLRPGVASAYKGPTSFARDLDSF